MEKETRTKKLYHKISEWLSMKNLTFIGLAIFILLLLPVLYLSLVNRASGDDYGYGTYTRAAWMSTHSLIAVGKAIGRTIRQYYYGWQGTWFSIALFTLQPEVFSDNAYWIVAPLMLFFWIGSTFYLSRQILVKSMKWNKWSYRLVTIAFLVICIQFVPSTKSSIFWFNGCAHYMIPFAMCQMTAAWLLQYGEHYKKSTFIGITVFMTLLGGANYQASLFVFIVALYIGVASWFLKKDKRILTLLVPIILELVGLFISMKAPGNKVRAGEEFGLSVSKGIETILYSFWYGIKDVGTYMKERPLIFAGLFFLFLLFIIIFVTEKEAYHFKHPIWLVLMLYCLYSAMQAPAIYAGVEVSRGVLNTNFQVFMLASSGILLILSERIVSELVSRWREKSEKKIYGAILLPGIIIFLLFAFCFRSNIKDSTFYTCLAYIAGGQAADYKEQMDLQTKLLEDKSVEDVVLPFINDEQGPLMHMPAMDNPDAWTNTVIRDFYGKNSVVAMERTKWIELYGERS